jgi:hypothetical protein
VTKNTPNHDRTKDAKYWEKCAAEARTLAEGFSDPGTKKIMLDIARSYELVAQSARQRAAGKDNNKK